MSDREDLVRYLMRRYHFCAEDAQEILSELRDLQSLRGLIAPYCTRAQNAPPKE